VRCACPALVWINTKGGEAGEHYRVR
jgi:hypothetical protein